MLDDDTGVQTSVSTPDVTPTSPSTLARLGIVMAAPAPSILVAPLRANICLLNVRHVFEEMPSPVTSRREILPGRYRCGCSRPLQLFHLTSTLLEQFSWLSPMA